MSLRLASRRIALSPEPPREAARELEVLFLGHAPGLARWSRLTARKRAELVALGLDEIVAQLPTTDETEPSTKAEERAFRALRERFIEIRPHQKRIVD